METLFSTRHMNVERCMNAMRVLCSTTMSYRRASFLSTAPSPNHPPAGTPVKVALRFWRKTVPTVMSPAHKAGIGQKETLDMTA